MIEAIIAIVMALISYFASKKAGADDATAAMVAAGAGLGTYYVATSTEWGKNVVDKLDQGWEKMFGKNGEEVKNSDGTDVIAPKGSEVQYNADGTPAKDGLGNVIVKLGETTGKVLESWGPAGTAGVIATTAAVTSNNNKWLWIGGAAALAFLALR